MNRLSEQEKAFVRGVYVNDESVLERSSAKIRAFLRKYPDLLEFQASSVSHRDAELPLFRLCGSLHDADRRAVRIRQIRKLIDIDDSCLLKQNRDQLVPLHHILYCLSNELLDDSALRELLRIMVVFQPSSLDNQNVAGDTALHIACLAEETDNLRVVRLLLDAKPKAAMVRNNCGELPLHLASMFQPTEVVQFLIRESPTTVFVHDQRGNLPLHSACAQYKSIEVIQLIVESCPIALMCKNEKNKTPLHIACQDHASVGVIEYLVQKNRDILGWRDQDGCLPLHYICETFRVNELVALMRLHMPLLPQLIQVKNKQGKTPGQDKDRWFQNFTKEAIGHLQEEHTIRETLDWMNTIADALQLSEAFPSAQIVLEWTKNHKEKCLEELARIESELNHLVDTCVPHEEYMLEMMYDQRNNQMLQYWHDYIEWSSD
jgi:ankyrin repeat protein